MAEGREEVGLQYWLQWQVAICSLTTTSLHPTKAPGASSSIAGAEDSQLTGLTVPDSARHSSIAGAEDSQLAGLTVPDSARRGRLAGSTQATRFPAARQIGDIAWLHPQDLSSLLKKFLYCWLNFTLLMTNLRKSDAEDVKDIKAKFLRDKAQAGEYYEKLKEEVELRKQRNISELNDLDEASRVKLEGFRTGTYLRLEVHDVPYEMVEHFDPCHPILVGGISLGEENVGYMQAAKPELGNKSKNGGSVKGGIARCTFEDRILMSDIVFFRAWTQVDIPCFFNPVTTALQPRDQAWRGMKTVAELRRENNFPIPHNPDSVYKPIERKPRKFNPVVIPRKLQKDLPFASKPKDRPAQKRPSLEKRRAVIMDSSEQRNVHKLLQHYKQIKSEKRKTQKLKDDEKRKAHEAEKAKTEHASKKRQQEEMRGRYLAEVKKARR